ncbi:hypothetical protein [Amycolatopsis sp. FDAARGOS 1241]|uniref:hypothetical protein n=1 Tax=Amycolatopsis sp. FDAARGOS 1241 TaxID=2778070 RepID=UPI001EF1AACE|nr:hypothetical protein [Amycolatopsis sp. FDAARGOS 1241]
MTGLAGFAVGLLVAALLVAGNSPSRPTGSSVPPPTPPPAQPVTVTVTGSPQPPVTVTHSASPSRTRSEPRPRPSTTTSTVLVTRETTPPETGSPTSLGPTSGAFVPNDASTRW